MGCTEDEGPHLDSVSAALAQGTLGTQWRLAELVHFVGWSVSFSWGHTVTLGLAARDTLRSMVLTFPTLMPRQGQLRASPDSRSLPFLATPAGWVAEASSATCHSLPG